MRFTHSHKVEELPVTVDGASLLVDADVELSCVACDEDVEFEVASVSVTNVTDADGEGFSPDAGQAAAVDAAVRAAMNAPKGTEAIQEALVEVAQDEGHRFSTPSRLQF